MDEGKEEGSDCEEGKRGVKWDKRCVILCQNAC